MKLINKIQEMSSFKIFHIINLAIAEDCRTFATVKQKG